jgi:hypothetical protein
MMVLNGQSSGLNMWSCLTEPPKQPMSYSLLH